MFTGLIEEIGRIVKTTRVENGLLIKISCNKILQGLKVDDSVAVQGTCLTVTNLDGHSFEAVAVLETVQKTTLAGFKVHDEVNLERALELNGRLGGHFVQGHVDGKGQLCQLRKEGLSHILSIELSNELIRYTIPKGSITINGVSLTIADKKGCYIELSVIPHTWIHTTLHQLKRGMFVNVEVDMMAKYVENFLGKISEENKKLDFKRLEELGY